MEEKFKVIIDELHKAMPGKILPSDAIYNAIYKAGMEYGNQQAYESGVYNGEAEGIAKGIREVVEWMFEPCPHAPRHFPSDKRMCVNCCEAKLKEWGL